MPTGHEALDAVDLATFLDEPTGAPWNEAFVRSLAATITERTRERDEAREARDTNFSTCADMERDWNRAKARAEAAEAEAARLRAFLTDMITQHSEALAERCGPPTITSDMLSAMQTIFIEDLKAALAPKEQE